MWIVGGETMETAIVNFRDVADKKKNPTVCLSAARYTGNCVNCKQFKLAQYKIERIPRTDQERLEERPWDKYKFKKTRLKIDEALKRINCKPFVSEEELNLLHKRDRLYDEKEKLQMEIKKIDELLEMPLQQMKKLIQDDNNAGL